MPEYHPWLVTPRNKQEFDELEQQCQASMEELYVKLQLVAATMNHRLSRPKSGSKWAEKLAWARVDLKAYARSVTKPIAKAGGAAIAVGKSVRLSHERFYDIHRVAGPQKQGGSGGFDFS